MAPPDRPDPIADRDPRERPRERDRMADDRDAAADARDVLAVMRSGFAGNSDEVNSVENIARLDRIDSKLDRMDAKLDRTLAGEERKRSDR